MPTVHVSGFGTLPQSTCTLSLCSDLNKVVKVCVCVCMYVIKSVWGKMAGNISFSTGFFIFPSLYHVYTTFIPRLYHVYTTFIPRLQGGFV